MWWPEGYERRYQRLVGGRISVIQCRLDARRIADSSQLNPPPTASYATAGPLVCYSPRRGADAVDDRGEDVGEIGAGDQQPLGVGPGRGDLQQRDGYAGVGQGLLDEAVVAELDYHLDADVCMARVSTARVQGCSQHRLLVGWTVLGRGFGRGCPS